MPSPVKENVNNGDIIQVFVPNARLVASSLSVSRGDIIRFSQAGTYEFNNEGIKVPFPAGRTIGIPSGVSQLDIFESDGVTALSQVIEVM